MNARVLFIIRFLSIFLLFYSSKATSSSLSGLKIVATNGSKFDRISYKNCSKHLPSAIIIGVKKSGTYALLRYLSINKEVQPALKINNCNLNEIHFFDQDENYKKGIEWYKNQMPAICDREKRNYRIIIEKTPGYFRSSRAIERISKFNQNIKLILIVRNPVKRLKSELTHCDSRQKKLNLTRKCSNINEYFEKILVNARDNQTLLDIEFRNNRFVRNSIYYLDLIKWTSKFNLSNIFILDGETFIKTPWVELNKLERFLNISNFIEKKHFYFDTNKNFFCINEKNIHARNNGKMTSPIFFENNITLANKEIDGCLGKNKGRKSHIYLSKYVTQQLELYFKKWNSLFFNLIGQKFDW